jgi:hypothetical protein
MGNNKDADPEIMLANVYEADALPTGDGWKPYEFGGRPAAISHISGRVGAFPYIVVLRWPAESAAAPIRAAIAGQL